MQNILLQHGKMSHLQRLWVLTEETVCELSVEHLNRYTSRKCHCGDDHNDDDNNHNRQIKSSQLYKI